MGIIKDQVRAQKGASQVALGVKNPPANAGNARDMGSIPESGRSPRRREWQPTPVFLPVKSHGQKKLGGGSVVKNLAIMQDMQV